MKIRTIIYALLALGVLAALGSCNNDVSDPVITEEVQLKLLPSIEKMGEAEIRTRSTSASFFDVGDQITVKVTTSRTSGNTSSHSYSYDANGVFNGDFYFRPDMTYITKLEALWPAEGQPGRMDLITDQRKYIDYKQANRLKAEANTENIMPTAAPVPLLFTHEQSRVTFRLAGQNANSLIIKELLLELDDTREGGFGKKGFWAYCGDGTEGLEENGQGAINPRLILPAGTQFGPGTTDGGRMRVGLVTVGEAGLDDNDYRGLIYIPNSTDITLKENTDYLVTLTPEGYDLYATITIGGFSQSEGHVGVPYQLPVENSEGVYEISTVAQLITISWLLSGEELSPLWDTTTEWVNKSFNIVNEIIVSDKVKAEGYLKAPVLNTNNEKFSNTQNVKYSDGSLVFGEG